MKKFFKKLWSVIVLVWKWLVYSSENPKQVSLFIRGIGMALVPLVLYVSNAYNLNLTNETLTQVLDAVVGTVIAVLAFVSTIQIALGAMRKVWSTYKGTNAVIASHRVNNQ